MAAAGVGYRTGRRDAHDGWKHRHLHHARRRAARGSLDGRAACRARHSRIDLERRVFVDGTIELLDGDAYPELSDARSPDEHPSPLAPGAIAEVIERGIGFLGEHWPAAIGDVRGWLRGVIVITAPGTHVYSASAAALPLIVKLTARSDESPPLLAETLVHETAHGKLESLWDMAPLLADDDAEPFHHHPWRPDPRPLRGVFLAAHVFANVMLLYRNAVERGWAEGAVPHDVLCGQVTAALDTLGQHAVVHVHGPGRLRASLRARVSRP